MAHLSLSMLGPLQVALDARPVTTFESNKVRALLAYLVLEADRPHYRDQLAGLLWPEWPDRAARSNLRYTLSNLRATIGDREAEPPLLLISREMIQFNQASDHWLDVRAFTEALQVTTNHSHRDLLKCAFCAQRLQEAVDLYQGELLAGFFLDSAPFEEWLVVRREELHRQALDALYHLGAYHEGCGVHERVIDYARRQVELEPWSERAHQQWMRALALSGQRGAALAQYEACRNILEKELGVEPEPETKGLYQRIREGTEVPATLPVPPLSLPVPLIPLVGREQLLEEVEGYLNDPACRLLNLVGPGGSGKTRLALEAATRLAQANVFRDGVYLASLAALRSVEGLVPAIARALGFSFSRDLYDLAGNGGAHTARQQLRNYLRQKNVLLVLDSFEHLLQGTDLVSELLAEAPEVRVLVTSRSALGVQGECRFHVLGLECPAADLPAEAADVLDQYSAIRLFVQGAERAQPGLKWTPDQLRDVSRICHLVQGMPLGILLAAAWAGVLSPAEIAAQISGEILGQEPRRGLDFLESAWSDVPERQRSMRAVFDHSWNLLSEREREVLAGMSVFRGGLTREAAQQVTGASLSDLLALTNRSVLYRTPQGRYEIHELLRQYAAEKLAASPDGEGAVHDRHAAHFVAALKRWAGDLEGPRQLVALAEAEADVENVSAAWQWAVERGQSEPLNRAMDGLCLFYERRGHYEVGRAVCQETCDRLAQSMSPDEQGKAPGDSGCRLLWYARALAWQGMFCWIVGQGQHADRLFTQSLAVLDGAELAGMDVRAAKAFVLYRMAEKAFDSDIDQSRQLSEHSLALHETLDAPWGRAAALFQLGQALFELGAYDKAKRYYEESLAIRRSLKDRQGIVMALWGLGLVLENSGDLVEAERQARECVDISREMGDEALLTEAHFLLSTVLHDLGRYQEAQAGRQRELATFRERGDRSRISRALLASAMSSMHLALYPEARALAQESIDLSSESGLHYFTAICNAVLGRVALAEGAYEAAQAHLQESVDLFRKGGNAISVGESIVGLAYAARELGQPAQALEYLYTAQQVALESGRRNTTLQALPALALLSIDRGEVERAVELYALASRYPYVANSRWFEDVAGREIAAAAEALPPEVVTRAQERGRARDLWATVEELLHELGGPLSD